LPKVQIDFLPGISILSPILAMVKGPKILSGDIGKVSPKDEIKSGHQLKPAEIEDECGGQRTHYPDQ